MSLAQANREKEANMFSSVCTKERVPGIKVASEKRQFELSAFTRYNILDLDLHPLESHGQLQPK